MEVQQRVKQLEQVHDWQGLLEEFEKALAAASQPDDKAHWHVQVGRLLDGKFLQCVKALKHFQDAYKLQPTHSEALGLARDIYWRLGKPNMVQKLLDLELNVASDPKRVSQLLLELGDVLSDQGDYERAISTYAKSVGASKGDNAEASACLEDAQIEAGGWQERVAFLLRAAHDESDGPQKGRLFLRAARIAKRFAPEETEGMLRQAFTAWPTNIAIQTLAEGVLLADGDPSRVRALQREVLDGISDDAKRSELAFAFAVRWATTHQNLDIGFELAEEAFSADANNEAAFLLIQLIGGRDDTWDRMVELAMGAAARVSSDGGRMFYLSQAAMLLWHRVGDMLEAQRVFEQLAQLAPEHPGVLAFEAQIGRKLTAGSQQPEVVVTQQQARTEQDGPEQLTDAQRTEERVEADEADVDVTQDTHDEPASEVTVAAAEASEVQEALEQERLEQQAQEQIAELREAAVTQEENKRFNELVRTLLALAELVPNVAEKVDLYQRAADLFVTKFANQAEAIKAYEKVVEYDPSNTEAVEYLLQMYEKRRDWESLITLRQTEAKLLVGDAKVQELVDIADLASKRLRKPDMCIDLWNAVLEEDPDNVQALEGLVPLLKNARRFEDLVKVLEKQVEVTYDEVPKIALLTELGTVYGDRLRDDEGAVRAWGLLLTLQPNDRRAQEQLRKRYIALRMWDDLELFYAESGKWDEFIRVLESEENREKDSEGKISLLMKVAQLWNDKKDKPDRASRALEKVLSIDENHLAAAEALIPIYEQADNARGLAKAIEVKLVHEQDEFERLALLNQVGRLYEEKIRDAERAFERYVEAFQISSADEICREDMERLAATTGRWPTVIEAYRQAIDDADKKAEADLATELRLQLGRVLVHEVSDIDQALVEYRAVYDNDSNNAQAIEALEQLYRQTSRFDDLLGIYERKSELCDDFEQRRQVLYEIASLYQTEMGQPARAIETYEAVLQEDPTDLRSLHALDALYLGQEDYGHYAEILHRLIELDVTEQELVDLKYRLGGTLERHLHDSSGALNNYREVLFIDPTHEGARGALENMLENEELAADAAQILDPIYEARADWNRLIGVLEVLAQHQSDDVERVEILRRISRTASSQLNDLDRAFDAQARALQQDPANDDARIELEELAEQSGGWDKLEPIYSAIAGELTDVLLARDYWMRLAAIEERLGKVDEAAEGYGHVLSLDPSDHEALEALDSLYRRTERWEDLVGVFRKRIDLEADMGRRVSLYAQVAQVYEAQLQRPDDAIAAYQEVLLLDETSQVALSALDGLFTRQQMWTHLAENLEAQLRLAPSDEAEEQVMLRLAALREGQMGEVEQAIDIYRQVLDRNMMSEAALSSLERLGTIPEHELHIAEILEPLYQQTGDFRKLIGVHEVQVRRSEDAIHRVELLHQIALLHEEAGGDLHAAFDTLARALAEDPQHDGTQEGLDRLARATSRYVDLARVYVDLGQTQEPYIASHLFATAARIYEQEIGDVDSAVTHYRKVMEIDPTNLQAAEALERLFRATEKYTELSQILQLKADILDDPIDKKTALFQAATIEEQMLNRHDAAIAVYMRALEVDPDDLQAVDALIAQYLSLGRWEDLLGVYTKKADLVFDPEEKKLIYYQMGAVYERELGDSARAIDTYQRVLEQDPDDLQALGRLDALYQQGEAWPELLTVLQHESELAMDPSESISYQYRIAELYEKHLDDVARGIELYRDLLMQQSDHAPTLEALERLKNGDREPLLAASVLEPFYDGSGQWTHLISVLEVQVRFQDDPFMRVDLLHRIAALYEENLQDFASAFDTHARALALDNANHDTLDALERLAVMTERWKDTAALYDAELDKLEDNPDWFVDLGLRTALLMEQRLEDIPGAVQRYRRVLEVSPDNEQALGSLDRLFEFTEQWSELAEVLEKEAEVAPGPDQVLEFRFRLGQVYQHRLADIDNAVQAYADVIAAAPEHHHALEALEMLFADGVKQPEIAGILEPLYTDNAQWEKLAGVHEAQLRHVTEPEDRLAAYYRVAEDYEHNLLDPVRAIDVYVRAIKEFPLDERVGEDIERLGGLIDGGWDIVGHAYADVLDVQQDPQIQKQIGKRHARVFEEELQQIDNAVATYRYVLGVDPSDVEALTDLDRIFEAMEQWPDLAQVIEQRVKYAGDTTEAVELHSRLGEVYEERLQQYDDGIRVYRRIFDDLEPTNEQAINALERLYEYKQAWPELNTVYERQLDNVMGDYEEAQIRAKMARLASDHLGNIDIAVDTWKRVLDLRGEDEEALGALANLHEARQEWPELCEVLERQFDIASSDEMRVFIRLRRAYVFLVHLNRDEQALDDYHQALDIDYSNVDALRAIAGIWRTRGDAYELVQALHSFVDRAASFIEPSELVAVYRELGTTYGQVLQQPIDAAEAWTHLLSVDPTDFEALDALEAIYRADERYADVVDVKMRRADALEDPQEKIRELLEVTKIWDEQIGDRDAGTLAYEQVLAIDATHNEAFLALEQLHDAAQRWEPLIELYLARLETREQVQERTELLRKIAAVFEQHVDDRNQAFDALLQAFAEDYGDDETTQYLERMAQATNRWTELIQTANGWLQAEQEQQDQFKVIQLCLRLAKWYGEDLGHTQYAQPYFQKVMQLDPTNVAVLRQMASLYRKNQQWQELGVTLTEALKQATSEKDRKEIQTEIGELLDKQMGDTDKGMVFYKNALEVDPYYLPALEALERIYTERQQTRELVEILAAKAISNKDVPEEVGAVNVRMGGLYEGTLHDLEKACEAYQAALDAEPANLLAMRGLERVYQAQGKWPEMLKVLEQQLDVVATERERIDVLMKLAGIFEEQFLKADEAAIRFEQVLEVDPNQEPALVGLERCYAKDRKWLDLVGAYERHISVTMDRSLKITLFGHIAHVFSDEVEDAERAIDAYLNIVDLDDQNVPALEALAKLYERTDRPADAIDYMTRVAELTPDPAQRVEMYYRIGLALDTQLGDRVAARERYEMALDLDPTHVATLGALKVLAMDAAEYDLAARYLDQEQMNTPVPRAKSKLLVELGALREEHLGEHEAAVQAYEMALEADPESEEAARPLLQEYVNVGRWQEADPLADMLLKKTASKLERFELHQLYAMQGKIAAELNNNEKALKAYKEAHHLDLTDQETIRGLAEVSFRVQDWAGALSNYQKVLTSLDEGDRDERAHVYFKLGCIKREQGQIRQAVNNFEKALAIDDAHRPTLDAMVDVYAGLNDWKQVCAYKRQILDNIFDAEERFEMLCEVGDIWAEKEKNLPKAVETLEEALELRPDSHVLLHKLLGLHTSTKNYQRMIDIIQTIADMEIDPGRKARYMYTMAQLYRDQQEMGRAVELFNEALDLNPDFLEAFERINKILTAQKDWKQLERSFRKMIHRIAGKGKTDLEYNLWHNLGVVYRDRLADVDKSIEAFRMASRIKPDDLTQRKILAELYETANQLDLAVQEQQEILRRDPVQVAPYRALYTLYYQKQAYDEAWCMCGALTFLGKANEDQQKFYLDYRPEGMPQVKNRLDNELWRRCVFHRTEDPLIGSIFEMLTGAALQAKIKQLQAANQLPVLDKRYKQEPHTTTVTFAKTFFLVAKVLGITTPELYVHTNIQGGLTAAPVLPFASVAGQSVLSGLTPHELSFVVAKHLSNYRGEHYIKNIFPTQSELTQLFFAGLRMVMRDAPVPPEMVQNADVTAKALGTLMQPQHLEGLRHLVKQFMDTKGAINIKRWLQATDLTACRAGLLVCGDLAIAQKILRMEPHVPGELTPEEKMMEMVVFSVSNEYFELRKALGIAIG